MGSCIDCAGDVEEGDGRGAPRVRVAFGRRRAFQSSPSGSHRGSVGVPSGDETPMEPRWKPDGSARVSSGPRIADCVLIKFRFNLLCVNLIWSSPIINWYVI